MHAAILALFSAALNGHVTQPGGRPVVVWTALVGRSSIGCKGTALEAADHILYGALADFLAVRRRDGISSGPSLINVLHEQYEKSLTAEDGPDGRIMVIEEEWQNQLRRTTRCPTYSGVFRTVWDGKRVSNTTKGKKAGEREEQSVEAPLMGFHSHIQPGAWAKYISATEALGGSYNRILPVLVQMSKVLPSPEEGEERPIYRYEPGRALKLAYDWARKEKRVMSLGSAARRRYDEIRMQYLEETAKLPEVLASFIERSAEQVWRVAAVLTAANRKTVIPVDAVEAAYAFVNYSIHSVTQLFNETVTSTSRTVTPLDELIRRALNRTGGEATRSQLYRSLGSGRYTAEEIEQEAEAMPDVEIYEIRVTGRSGAKPKKFRLITAEEPKPDPVTIPAQGKGPSASDAEALLTAYAEWASQPGNVGKSVSDYLAALQAPAKVPARKAPAKRSAAPRKTAKTASSASATTPAKKTAARKATVAKTAAKKVVPASAAKKAPAARNAAGK
ncbi:DUF3987 domain-containing protein [Streptomyces sp. NPDC004682]